MREAIEGAGRRLLYLPSYNPDLNPIERAFAELKALLRRAGERTVEGLWRLLGRLLDEFGTDECHNYLLVDALGRPLDGDRDSHPGGDFAATVTKKGVTPGHVRPPQPGSRRLRWEVRS